MSLCVISDKSRIRCAQERLEECFGTKKPKKISSKRFGHPGSGHLNTVPPHVEVFYIQGADFWFCPSKHLLSLPPDRARYWNGFGRGEPDENKSLSPDCEICVPCEGINRRVQGAFAEYDGKISVLHRGKFRKIRKVDFLGEWEKQGGKRVTAEDGGQESEFALIGELEELSLLDEIAKFAKLVREMRLRS